jgi:hypothetical protein
MAEMSLVEFLADLRSDLVLARERAVEDAVRSVSTGDSALWLEVDDVSVTLEVVHTDSTSVKASAGAEGKFWIFASAKATTEVGGEKSRTGTQTLTLTLKPRFDRVVKNSDGTTTIESTKVNIAGKTDESPLAGIPGVREKPDSGLPR